jgi:hypothetical protein
VSEDVIAHRARISRRRLLAAGGGLAAATMVGTWGRSPVAAAVPPSARFDLSKPSHDLFRGVALVQQTVLQSFAFDNVNRRLFAAQLMNGSSAEANGDLCINELDFAGKHRGSMFLTGFGHGVSIGVEPGGAASYLWTEVDSVNSRGTQLARFRFTNGATLDHTSTTLQKHLPIAGIDTVTCATDPINDRLVMRYRTGGSFRYAVYTIADIRDGRYDRKLADIAQPSELGTFQGYTVYGQYLYMLDGDPYSDANPPPGNAHVSSVSLDGGSFIRVPTNAGGSLTHREPEGMAVYRTVAGETRLFLGFASGAPGARRANLFYKNVLV